MASTDQGNVSDITTRQERSTPIVEGLQRLTAILTEACPADAIIHFDFREKLRVLIDVRSLEDLMAVEAALKMVSAGSFHTISRTTVPGHSFLKRVVAFVEA